MLYRFMRIVILFLFLGLAACAKQSPITMTADLAQGQRYFETGYYRKALHVLLPLALDGNIQSQYAVGYMYYYGYGMPQDTESGCFWIERAANKGYQPAIEALKLIESNHNTKF